MQTSRLILFIALASAAATGCSTPTPDAAAAPAATILAPDLTAPRPGAEPILVKRDSDVFGVGTCRHQIALDGRPVAELRAGEAITIYAGPGAHILSASTPAALCPGGTIEVAVNLVAGQRAAYRVGRPTGGDLMLMPTAY